MKVVVLVIYFAILVGIGLYCRKHATDVNGFVLGGRSVGPWLTAFAYGTSYFSAVVFVGYAGQFGWKYGLAATWAGIGNAIIGSLFAWMVLGRRTRVMTQHLDSATMPQFFGRRFDSKSLKIGASVIIFIFLIPYTASLYNGLSRLFGMAFNIDYSVCILLMAILTAIYVIAGGYMATAINDFIQGIIMLIGIAAVVIAVLNDKGGLFAAIEGMKQVSDESIGAAPGAFASILGPDPVNLIFVVLLTSLGTWGLPQMVQKFYAIKSEKSIAKGAIISTIFALVVAGGSYFMGGFVRLYCTTDPTDTSKALISVTNGKPAHDTMVPALLDQALPDMLIGLVVVLVLSASLSTLSSLVLTSSSTLTNDMIKPKVKGMTDKKQMTIMRVLIAVFLVISVIIAANPNASISTLMSYSWGALSGSFLGPFLYGLFSKKTTKAACIASFCTGVGIPVIHMTLFGFGFDAFAGLTETVKSWELPINLLSPINAGVFSMLISLIIVPIVSKFTRKPDDDVVENAFSSLKTSV